MQPSHDDTIYQIGRRTDIEMADVKRNVEEPKTNNPTPEDLVQDSSPQELERHRHGKLRTFTVMTALCCTLLIAALNNTIVATAVPTISAKLQSASGYAWISGAYGLATATAAPVWAKLSDIWGRKPILLTAVALFFFTSILCALAQSMKMLIVGRAFQGTAGGGLVQLVYITISDMFSMRSRTIYLGFLQIMWAIAGGVGPIIGGSLAEFVDWRWVFWINLPVSGTTFFLLMFLDVHNPRTELVEGIKAIDWFGSLSLLGLMVMLLLGLNFGGATFPWNSPTVICLIIFGGLMSIFFVFSEKHLARHPLMPLGLFRSKSNIATLVVGFMHDFAVFATEYYLPLYLQSVKGASPLHSGLLILPITLTQALVAIATSVLVHQTGRYLEIIWIGVVLLTLGNGLYINLDTATKIGAIIGFEVVAAIGAGLLFQPPLIALQALVSPEDTATATATLGFVRSSAISLAIVIGGVVFQNGMDLHEPRLTAAGLPANLTESLSGHAAAANVMLIETIADPAQRLAVKDAFAGSLRNLWILCTCTSACAVVASGFIVKQKLSKVHVEVKTGLKNPRGGMDRDGA